MIENGLFNISLKEGEFVNLKRLETTEEVRLTKRVKGFLYFETKIADNAGTVGVIVCKMEDSLLKNHAFRIGDSKVQELLLVRTTEIDLPGKKGLVALIVDVSGSTGSPFDMAERYIEDAITSFLHRKSLLRKTRN